MSAPGRRFSARRGRVPGEVADLLLFEEQPDDVLRLAREARLVDVDDLELRVREPRRGLRNRVALREADADDQVVVLADERRHVRDVVGGGRGLEDATLDAELPLGSLETVVRELVEATVVQLPFVGEQPDLDRVLVGPGRRRVVIASAGGNRPGEGGRQEESGKFLPKSQKPR